MFIVMAVQTKADLDLFGKPTPVDLKFASGMIGVLPVFMSRKAAMRYVGSKSKLQIVEVEEKNT